VAGFVDVLLRGLLLTLVGLAVGGVAWVRLVLRAEPGAKPDAAARASLHLVVAAALGAAAAQIAVAAIVLVDLAAKTGGLPLPSFAETTFARAALGRAAVAAGLGVVAARLAGRPAGRGAWAVLTALAGALVLSSAVLSHAMARLGDRALLLGIDAVHQAAVATWVGGLAHLTLHALRSRGEHRPQDAALARRFSGLALVSVATLVASGLALTVEYVGDPAALVGTAYGVMILSKVALLLATLGLAAANFRMVRRASAPATSPRLGRLVEVELGLAVTIVYAAASLTSLPPSIDVRADRAAVSEVAARFVPAPPRLSSPPIAELLRAADPLMAPVGARTPVERAWSEYNHHWSGLFVLLMGLLAVAEGLGVRAGRHWPLALLGLALFMFFRNDPRAWPLGPAGFWESMMLPDVLQHRAFVVLVVVLGVFEWMVRTRRLAQRPWAYVFPLLCAVGGGLLLTHSHAMFNLKEEFLTEVTHAPLGIFGAFAGWARWLEVRLPGAGRTPGWVWRGCLVTVGLILLFYREG
jgi:putative copper resistance protein D